MPSAAFLCIRHTTSMPKACPMGFSQCANLRFGNGLKTYLKTFSILVSKAFSKLKNVTFLKRQKRFSKNYFQTIPNRFCRNVVRAFSKPVFKTFSKLKNVTFSKRQKRFSKIYFQTIPKRVLLELDILLIFRI